MSQLKRPFKFGKITLPSNVFYSPLAGCSDFPFRKMAAKYRPGLIYCEMVKMDALVRNDFGTFHILDYEADMHPIGGQIVGSKVEIAGKAAKIIEDLGFDVVDLNCGCPVDKVTRDGGGSGLLKDPRRIGDIICEMVAAVDIPVTVKIRAGWDDTQINAAEITRIAEEAGATAIAIHGRTRKQAYRGPANWDHIRDAKQAAKNILVIGNGDVFDAEAAKAMFDHTACDAVLCSRGTMGNPWIADDIYRALEGRPAVERGPQECKEALLEHFDFCADYYPTQKVVVDMRRIGCWYMKRTAATREFRGAISKVQTLPELKELIHNFCFASEETKDGERSHRDACHC